MPCSRARSSVLGERDVAPIFLAAGVAPELGRLQAIAGLTPDDLAVVVEELVMNLYDHGDVGPGDEIMVDLSLTEVDLRLALTDSGQSFDPGSADNGDLPQRGGGAGLKLVRAWASQIRYQSADGRNQLVVHLPVRRA